MKRSARSGEGLRTRLRGLLQNCGEEKQPKTVFKDGFLISLMTLKTSTSGKRSSEKQKKQKNKNKNKTNKKIDLNGKIRGPGNLQDNTPSLMCEDLPLMPFQPKI